MPTSATIDTYATEADYLAAVTELAAAAAAYYNGTGLLMADIDYDTGTARVAATEVAHPAWTVAHNLETVAAGTGTGDVEHSTPMLSLDKVMPDDPDRLTAWIARTAKTADRADVTFTVEPKLDGIAAAIHYTDGQLARIVTRGDGRAGEDITARFPTDRHGLPSTLPEPVTVEVRGEVHLTDTQFEVANTRRVTVEGKTPFANSRNSLAGMLRREDLDAADRPAVSVAIYSIHGTAADRYDTATAALEWARSLGFTPALGLAGTATAVPAAAIEDAVAAIGAARETLDFDIDGAVIKVDDIALRDELGATGSHPRWAVAVKYPAQEATTILEDIEVQVGRTGIHSLRGRLTPVEVHGVVVEYATLHNPSDLETRDVRPGDTVIVRRAGDVIPEIVGHTHRPADSQPWIMPTECIACGTALDTSEKRWRCLNRDCTAGRGALLAYAVSRDALDIDGVSEALLAALGDKVTDIGDLYTLTETDIASLDGYGTTSAANAIAAINTARTQPLARLVTALGIRMTGRRMSRRLAAHFGTLARLSAATEVELAEVEGVGPRRATTIRSELDALAPLLARLEAAGINTVDENWNPETGTATDASNDDGPLAGHKIVITGAVPGYSRTEAGEYAESLGAKVTGSVSKNTTLVVVGDGAGAAKLTKAETLGVPVMPADEFAALAP